MLAARPRILVLDDEAYRITLIEEVMAPALVYGTDFVPDFVQQAQHGGWNMMFLDYDLAADPSAPTGADAAASIGDPSGPVFRVCAHVPVVVHSLNLSSSWRIFQALWAWEGVLVRLPFHRVAEMSPWLRALL